jgi:hypothetical protein
VTVKFSAVHTSGLPVGEYFLKCISTKKKRIIKKQKIKIKIKKKEISCR